MGAILSRDVRCRKILDEGHSRGGDGRRQEKGSGKQSEQYELLGGSRVGAGFKCRRHFHLRLSPM
jgi:hypothetical protein